MSADTSTKRTLMQILILFHMHFFSCHKSSIKLFHCSTKTLTLRRAKSNVTNRFRTILHGRSLREKYKEYRVHRPFIRKEILWRVLWAALKTSDNCKTYLYFN